MAAFAHLNKDSIYLNKFLVWWGLGWGFFCCFLLLFVCFCLCFWVFLFSFFPNKAQAWPPWLLYKRALAQFHTSHLNIVLWDEL